MRATGDLSFQVALPDPVRTMMATNGPREPAAAMRQAASAVREIFVALVNEGFSEDQALKIVGHILRGQQSG